MKEVKVGQVWEVKTKPSHWSSHLCGNNPLHENFPMTVTIQAIKPTQGHTAIKAGDFGWDLKQFFKVAELQDENSSNNFKFLL